VADHGAGAGFTAGPGEGPLPLDDRAPGESEQLSALLAEIARIPEADVDPDLCVPGLARGDVVGKLVVERELARGGFGVVYEALDRVLRRPVAFKVLRPGTRRDGEERVRAEAEALARLNHPNIVTLHDVGRCRAGPFLVFELLRGATLAERMRGGPLPVRDAVDVAVDVARALAHAHRAGVLHRDLKPANVFLCEDGAVKVLDFGLAHLFGRAAASGGTPTYMAPEQWRGEAGDARTDLFALGVLLHQLLSGAPPYRVSRDRSEALDPGPPPLLPRRVAPAPLRALVARLLEKDPDARPQTAQAVLDALLPLQRRLARQGGWRSARGWLAAATALATAAAVAWFAVRPEAAPPTDPRVVVVADVDNQTGEGDLDGVSGLLITSLEQSRRFRVLTRSRLLGLLHGIHQADVARIDEPVARELARAAGAGVLLVASVRRADEDYTLEVRGLDPRDGTLFSVQERAPAKASVLGAVDRLSDAVRGALREGGESRGARIDVAQAVTPSLEAYQAYFDGLDCWERPSRRSWAEAGECAVMFREALSRDPGFALAHYQLAFILHTERRSRADVEEHLQAALRTIDRAPPKEATLVRAWAAHVAGRDDEALAAYARILTDHPDDKHALYVAAFILCQRRRLAEAVPYLQRLLEVDPAAEWPLDDLVTALALLRRWDALRALVARDARPGTPARSHARVRGLVWLADTGGALLEARRAVARGDGPAAELDLAAVSMMRGEVEEARSILEAVAAAQPSDLQAGFALARALAALGRRREGLAELERLAKGAETQDQGVVQYARAAYLAGDATPDVLWREVAKAHALAPALAAPLVPVLALRGDPARAQALAQELEEGSTAAEEYAAIAAWRRGDAAGAISRLTALELRDPWPEGPIPPSYLLAEVSAATGDWAATLAAVERFRALWPRGLWPGWALPRAAYLAARAHAGQGDAAAARAEIDRVLGWWKDADGGHPLAGELKALEVHVGK
jgi:tetratricopeptide (TPR) repeat protein/predicted Ser/Thr protein kinase